MMCQCAICGFIGHVHDYHQWESEDRRYPALWICDVCYVELNNPGTT